MSDDEQAAHDAARAYEALHVDALFRQFARPVLAAAGAGSGQSVLDVACGTGAAAREAVATVGPDGSVTGVDIDPGMLAVAAELEPDVRWLEGAADALPCDDDEFDAVVSQFGLMFFPDRVAAVREMLRCAKPGAAVVVAVWDALERSAAYPDAVNLLERRAGTAAADALRAPFVLGDVDELQDIVEAAGATEISITPAVGTARFPSVRSMVEADLRGWLPLLGVVLDEELIQEILTEADHVLARYVVDGGAMHFPAPAHLISMRA